MASKKPILPSKIPTEIADKWTNKFNKLFKKRYYGELKSKVNYRGLI